MKKLKEIIIIFLGLNLIFCNELLSLKSPLNSLRINETDSSSTSSESSTSFTNKKKLLKIIRSFLKYDKHELESTVDAKIKKLKKETTIQLIEMFNQDIDLGKRYRFLQYVKFFLIQYQNISESQANERVNQLDGLSTIEMYQKYYGWCQKLTKNQMLEMIHEHVQFDQGFFGVDADQEIAKLDKQPLPAIRDRFMQYQKTFVTKELISPEFSMERKLRLQQQFNQQKKDQSVMRRVPLVKNIEELLPSRITNWSDQQLFDKLAIKMRDIGISDNDIHQEIELLKKSSIADLQKNYPHLQLQLANQLYYFDLKTHQNPDWIKSADFWLQQLHSWGTVATMITSYGAASLGYNTSVLDAISGFALFDPRLTFSYGVTKRDLLDMIYAQYSAFDVLHHVYMNHEYQETLLWTKSELLQKISDCLVSLNVGLKARNEQEIKNQKLNQQELQFLYKELKYFIGDKQQLNLSLFEKKILIQTKFELLKFIKKDLQKLEISPEKIDQTMQQLEQENINFIRSARIDVHEAVLAIPIKKGVLPTLISTKELLIRQAPKTIARIALDNLSDSMKNDWHRAGKSPAYIHWKTSALQDHIANEPDGKFERVATRIKKGYKAFSLLGLRHQLPSVPDIPFEVAHY